MKIILLQSVRGLGGPGDIVNVKSGYARNYLIPKEIAVFATESNVNQIENRIAKAKEIEADRVETLKGVAEKLDKLSLKFELKAGEEDKLFGSVTTQMISDSLSNEGYTIERKDIDVEIENLVSRSPNSEKEIRRFYKKPSNRQRIEDDMVEKKILEYLNQFAKVKEVEVNTKDIRGDNK